MNDGESCFTDDGLTLFTLGNSICDSHYLYGPNDCSMAEQIVEEFMRSSQAARVQPLPAYHVAIPAQCKRMLRRRETRAILKQYYDSQKKLVAAKKADNSRRKHAARRPRINGRFLKKNEIAAVELANNQQQQEQKKQHKLPETTTKKALRRAEYSSERSGSPSNSETMASENTNGDKLNDDITDPSSTLENSLLALLSW